MVDGREILTAPKKPRAKKNAKKEEPKGNEEEPVAIPVSSEYYGTFDPDEEGEDGDGNSVPWYEDAEEEPKKEAEKVTEEEPEEEESEEEEIEEAPVAAPRAIDAGDPTVALIDVCTFDKHFESGAVINLDTLKSAGLVDRKVTKLKLFASGELKGKFTVEANHFTLDAIMAISAADGDSVMIR